MPIAEILKVGEIFQEVREQEGSHREYQLSSEQRKETHKSRPRRAAQQVGRELGGDKWKPEGRGEFKQLGVVI